MVSFTIVNCNDYGADVYYTIDVEQNRITIHTKHFTVYVIESIDNPEFEIISRYPERKVVNLKAAIYAKAEERRTFSNECVC
jgi:hypothetical protein